MTRHVKTDQEAVELAELQISSLRFDLKDIAEEVTGIEERVAARPQSGPSLARKLGTLTSAREVIEGWIPVLEDAAHKLRFPNQTWPYADEDQLEKNKKALRLVVARMFDKSSPYERYWQMSF